MSLMLASCSGIPMQTKLKFGDEVYYEREVREFLNGVNSVRQVDKIYTWSFGADRIPYFLYTNKKYDNSDLRQKFKKAIEVYNQMLGLNFVEADEGEDVRAFFAFVESHDEVADQKFVRWMLDFDSISENDYQQYWLERKGVTTVSELKFGNVNGKNTKVAQFLIVKHTASNNLSLASISRYLCTAFYPFSVAEYKIRNTCDRKTPKGDNVVFPADEAVLKTIYQIDGISEMKKEDAIDAIMEKLIEDYGVN